jgi:hypothetical protein
MTTTDPALAAYDRMLAAYTAEPDTADGVLAAQNLAERLIVDDVFVGRLRALLAELQERLADERRNRQLAVEYAIDVLHDLLNPAGE